MTFDGGKANARAKEAVFGKAEEKKRRAGLGKMGALHAVVVR